MNRIRYKKTTFPTILESKQAYDVGASQFKVRLNTGTLTYSIDDLTTETEVSKGEALNVGSLKKLAKSNLESLGVVFARENRVRATS